MLTTVLLALGLLAQATSSSPVVPLPCAAPAEWTVVSDFLANGEQAQAAASKLGVGIISLRNTVFATKSGPKVQINQLLLGSADDAKQALAKLRVVHEVEDVSVHDTLVVELVIRDVALDPADRTTARQVIAGMAAPQPTKPSGSP